MKDKSEEKPNNAPNLLVVMQNRYDKDTLISVYWMCSVKKTLDSKDEHCV